MFNPDRRTITGDAGSWRGSMIKKSWPRRPPCSGGAGLTAADLMSPTRLYGRKQGNGGTRNAGVVHAATWSRPGHWTALFAAPRFCIHAPADPSAEVEADKIGPRITSC